MAGIFSKIQEKIAGKSLKEEFPEEFTDDYIQIDATEQAKKARVIIRPFIIEDFADIKPTLDALREGYTIALINIKPIKDKDIVELKRAVEKIKKTCEAIGGDIAGFGDDWIVVTPSFATVYRRAQSEESLGQ